MLNVRSASQADLAAKEICNVHAPRNELPPLGVRWGWSVTPATTDIVETDIPARLDRLPWSRFHTLVVVALGITWILDGLEVTLAGSVAGALKAARCCSSAMPTSASPPAPTWPARCWARCSSAGSPTGSGARSSSSSRLRVYLVATAATALVVEFLELRAVPLPHRRRHRRRIRGDQFDHPGAHSGARARLDRSRRSTAASGSARRSGALGSIVLLDPALFAPDIGWRVGFCIGAVLALVILFMRLWLPESPRWLITHGRAAEAERDRRRHRARVRARATSARRPLPRVRLRARRHTPLREVVAHAVQRLPPRARWSAWR